MANGTPGFRAFRSSLLEDLIPQREEAFHRLDPRSFRPPDRNASRRNGSAGDTTGPSPRERRRQLLEERRDLLIDTDEMERPSFDAEQSRLNQIVTGVGAATSLLGALGGSEIIAAGGAGLARGGAKNLRRQRESYRRRRDAFREKLQRTRQFNRDVALSTNEALVRGTEERIERRAEREASRLEHKRGLELEKLQERLDAKMTPRERRRFEKELDYLDAQIEAMRTRTEERRRTGGSSGSGGSGATFPDTIGETQAKINELIEREQQALDRGAGNDELGRIQDRILQLKRHRDALRQGGGAAPAPPRDTTGAEADTTAPADTTRVPASDAPVRGLGRTGQANVLGPFEDQVAGAPGGGGTGEPSHGVTRLDPSTGGSGDYHARTTDSLVEDALGVAWELGPQEAERRLDGLVEEGRLSPEKRDAVVRRMRLEREEMIRDVHGKAPATAILDDVAAVDSLDRRTARAVAGQLRGHAGRSRALRAIERASNAGRLSDSQANALRGALEQSGRSRQEGQAGGVDVSDREIARALELMEEGAFTAQEFEKAYGVTAEDARSSLEQRVR